MQNPKVNLLACNRSLKVALDFLRDYRSDENFLKVIDEAKKIAETMEIEGRFPNVPIVRIRRKNKQFEYESADDPILDPQLNYKINFFNFILDTAITSINERFEQMEKHTEYYEFLYNIYELKYKDKSEILKYCKDLQLILTDGENTDIDGIEICEEIINLAALLPSNMYPIEILNYLAKNNMTTIFPNLCVSLRILLTLPVSVASGERSFSKLKIIKNYLRSSMGQERLVGLSLMSIESAIAESLDYDVLIKDFAEIKVRRVPLIN